MKSILRATGVLASSSAVTVGASVVSAKAAALLIGPAGVGYLGILQSAIGVVSLVAGVGLATGLVRLGAAALARGDTDEAALLARATTGWSWALGAGAAAVLLALHAFVSRHLLHGLGGSAGVWAVAAGVLFSVVFTARAGVLNAHHRVEALAALAVTNGVLGASVTILALWLWRAQGVPVAAAGGFVISALVASWFVRRRTPRFEVRRSAPELGRVSRSLFRFGGPYAASMVVGTGVQLALPMVVLGLLDAPSVGYYRAATALSVGYLGFLLNAMAQDYYPRVSAAAGRPPELRDLANTQLRLVNTVGVPVILCAQLATPYLVPLLYARSFSPAVQVLQFQWVGDLFKLWAWTLSFIVLADSGSRSFFLTELAGGSTLLLSTLAGVGLFGLQGLGVGYAAATAGYLLLVLALVRRSIGFRFARENLVEMATGLSAVLMVLVLGLRAPEWLRLVAGTGILLAISRKSVGTIWREFRPSPA